MTKTWPFCEFRADGSLVICNYGEHGGEFRRFTFGQMRSTKLRRG